jgi:hypothetical protein
LTAWSAVGFASDSAAAANPEFFREHFLPLTIRRAPIVLTDTPIAITDVFLNRG